jgi:hypothetical protein
MFLKKNDILDYVAASWIFIQLLSFRKKNGGLCVSRPSSVSPVCNN